MRIGIDACCWANGRGFGRFTRELVSRLVTTAPQHDFVLFCDRQTAERHRLPDAARQVVVPTSVAPTEAASADGARSPADLWRMARAVQREPLDAFFFPAVYSFFPLLRRIPAVVTFHDAIAERHPQLVFRHWWARQLWGVKTRLALRQCRLVLTVSQEARRQVRERFHVAEARLRTIHEAAGPEFHPLNDPRCAAVRERYHLPDEPLLLYVGGISPHKNVDGLIRALARLRDEGQRVWHLALVGDAKRDGFHSAVSAVRDEIARCRLESQVTWTGFVENDDLVALYNTATMLVLPSLDEGFGLPVIEALACGLPVAISRRGSLPEVAGDAAVYFDPENIGEIITAVGRLLDEESLRADLRIRGLARSQQLSWDAAAAATVQVIEEAVHA